ncbi:MAG: hypothetical protein FWE40_08535 [Oscillospiraceae bacterium]|nr:hypothetical protein [Oscillospiraceae bacterium]
MANQQQNNAAQAWASFAETGSITDYLRYRALENRADQTASEVTNANTSAHPAGKLAKRKRPPDHGAH